MADTATKTTTPRKPRTPRTPRTGTRTVAKATPAKTAPPVEETAPAPTVEAFTVDLEYVSDTKSYAKFAVPENLKGTLAGNIYAPLGTDRVRLRVIGVDGEED